MSNDIRSILDRLATVEGRLSPAQQKVPQLPALFKPKHIRALGAKTDPAHPMDGYMVGDSVEPRRTALEEAMAEIEEDMLSKVKKDLTTYLDKLEKKVAVSRDLKDKAQDAVQKGQAEEDLDEFAPVGGDDREPDEEEILRQLAAHWWNGTEQQMAKAQNTLAAMGWEIGPDESGDDDAGVYVYRIGDEDGRDTVAFAHSDLDLNEEIDTDPAAIQGPSDPGDTEVAHAAELDVDDKLSAPQAPVATFEMDDGIALECWGNDNQGYELRRGKQALPSKFKNLDHAGMAVKLYQARKKRQQRPEQDLGQDYIEER
jgi:hypothetical protein